jgi:hypothetical protein
MGIMSDYSGLTRSELERRLAAAEDVCLMYAWSAPSWREDDRTLALYQLWQRWVDISGDDLDPHAHPELVGAESALAAQRRARIAEVKALVFGRLQ